MDYVTPASSSPPSTKRPKILLVEDDAFVMEVTQALLRKHFEVVSAASVPEATHHITAQHFDVLLTDLHLPGDGDGYALVNVMRQTQPEALILLASGSMVDAKLASALEIDEVIMKPYEVDELAQRIVHKLQPANRGRERSQHA